MTYYYVSLVILQLNTYAQVGLRTKIKRTNGSNFVYSGCVFQNGIEIETEILD